ncbi:MAG: LruC domain-containing protein, partial [Pseudomonadota bacterium]
ENGSHEKLAELGISGTFGAAYFDPDGHLYVGRNHDGYIFRIAVNTGEYVAEHFAIGPPSNINDGSRCAIAPVNGIVDNNIDFGDAPDSYGTTLASNGARHSLSDLHLGGRVDGESDSSAYPLSDDDNNDRNDEDGVQFGTSIVEGKNAVVVVKSTGPGYLNAWLDTDNNGQFDGNDHILTDHLITNERESIYVAIPDGAVAGKTWARFRLSTEPGLLAVGGAPDGEVEDYQVEIHQQELNVNHYPSATGWTTLAFEDNWPHEGDYDMNDLVVYMRTSVSHKESGVTKVNISGEIAAVGAAYHNGFAVRLPGVKRSMVDHENVSYTINDQPAKWLPIEGGRDEAILMVTYNLWDYVGTGEHCLFYRTESECGSSIQMKFEAEIPMIEPVDAELKGVLDPFLFATPGAWHGGHFVEAPGRSYEIHLKNQSPTEAFDVTLFDREGEDASNPEQGLFFQTNNGLPWALEIGTRWEYPIEYHEISHAYPLFARYAQSSGLDDSHWYTDEYTDQSFIFKH